MSVTSIDLRPELKRQRGRDKPSVPEVVSPPGRRWLWVVYVLLLASVVAALAAGGMRALHALESPRLFPLRRITIDGRLHHVSDNQIRRIISGQLGKGMLGMSVAIVRDEIQALPWVRRATVRRVWPGELEIRIREQIPLARWGAKALLNRQGNVFAPDPATFPKGLPQLSGPDEDAAEVAGEYDGLNKILAGLGRRITDLKLDDRGSWRAQLDDGTVLELGRTDIDARARRLVTAFPLIKARAGVRAASIDLRYPNGFAVQWVDRSPADGKTSGSGKE